VKKLIRKILYIFLLVKTTHFYGQEKHFYLESPSLIQYQSQLYLYGINNGKLIVYILQNDLLAQDSLYYPLPVDGAKSRWYIQADTSYGSLDFIIHRKEQQKGIFICLGKPLRVLREFKDIDITQINTLRDFNYQAYTHRLNTFVVKQLDDTTGRMFYLSKYLLFNTSSKPANHSFLWQYNFGKKNIGLVKMLFADSLTAYSYVVINEGERKGSWLLKLNAQNGQLIRGKKISLKSGYEMGLSSFAIDTVNKEMVLAAQLIVQKQLTDKLFICRFDSLMELAGTLEIPIRFVSADPKSKPKSIPMIQFSNMHIKSAELSTILNLYKDENTYFQYIDSKKINLSIEDALDAPIEWKENPGLSALLLSTDKNNPGGRIWKDTTKHHLSLFYGAEPVKTLLGFKINTENQAEWLLRLTDYKTNQTQIKQFKPGKKNYEALTLFNADLKEIPIVRVISDNTWVILRQTSDERVVLNKNSW